MRPYDNDRNRMGWPEALTLSTMAICITVIVVAVIR